MAESTSRKLELLAPAKDEATAIEAVKHGADAVYMGGHDFGARKAAANSVDSIKKVVEFAHIFNSKVYITLNTIIYDKELSMVEKTVKELWKAGVDALIVQDMALLQLDIPPIELHASTQCDIRTPEKALFLQEAGFSQLVLARELSLKEIKKICSVVSVPVETFVHGALCTGFSGRCQAGYYCAGRSGNRGECSQICRLPFTLKDASGKIIADRRFLLSLKDFNAYGYLQDLIEAGVSSFKIEGRLKDAAYVKNVVASYSRRLNELIEKSDGALRRSSFGDSEIRFEPDLNKSFNRGFTSYRLTGMIDRNGITASDTPKSKGEPVSDVSILNPGDGVSGFNTKGEYVGVQVNKVIGKRIIGNKALPFAQGSPLYRTSDIKWEKLMRGETAERTLDLAITLENNRITAEDETGAKVTIALNPSSETARTVQNYEEVFSKLGNSVFRLKKFKSSVNHLFFPRSYLSEVKRNLIEALMQTKRASYSYTYRREENKDYKYSQKSLESSDNVANRLSRDFYKRHGVEKITPALEIQKSPDQRELSVMVSKHCILREQGLCLKQRNDKYKKPFRIENGSLKLQICPDCESCEMHLRPL